MASCRACDAPIKWSRLPSGRFAPLDPNPNPYGEIVLLRDDFSAFPIAPKPVLTPMVDPEAQERRYNHHHGTCPLGHGIVSFVHLSKRLEAELRSMYRAERRKYREQTGNAGFAVPIDDDNGAGHVEPES
jgi:hypothetical protein